MSVLSIFLYFREICTFCVFAYLDIVSRPSKYYNKQRCGSYSESNSIEAPVTKTLQTGTKKSLRGYGKELPFGITTFRRHLQSLQAVSTRAQTNLGHITCFHMNVCSFYV